MSDKDAPARRRDDAPGSGEEELSDEHEALTELVEDEGSKAQSVEDDSSEDNEDQEIEKIEEIEDIAEAELTDDSLATVSAERDSYLDSLRRLQAEFENFRKRVTRERAELLARASEALVERLLPVLDALDLAVAHADATENGDRPADGSLGQIANLLRDVLRKEGLDAIAETGVAFDPRVHDAVVHEPGEEGQHDPIVIEVLRPGYEVKGKVLRPAMVKVRG